jgi:cytoskeletal protein CcmA (bactofilin family)
VRKILSRCACVQRGRTAFKEEKGAVLPLALIILMVGIIVTVPFLNLTITSMASSGVYEERLFQVYAADAGIEWGIWQVRSGVTQVPEGGEVALPEFLLNGLTVDVSITDMGERRFKITSTCAGISTSTSIEADAFVDSLPFGFRFIEVDATFDGGMIASGNFYIEGNAVVEGGSEITGDLYVEGDVSIAGGANIVNGDIVTGGDLYVAGGSQINGDVCVEGNLVMGSEAVINGYVNVKGNITMGGQSKILQDAYVDGSVTLNGKAEILGDYPLPYVECPIFTFPEGDTTIETWDISYD